MRGLSIATALSLGLVGGCQPSTDNCGGFCGAGTECREGRCEVAEVELEEDETDADEDEPKKKRRRRRRGRKGGDGDDGSEAGAGLPDNDASVPRFRADRLEKIGEGTERLSDRKVRQELRNVEPAFNRCLARAAAVTDAELSGSVSFQIGIEPSGKVWGVNAKLPSSWAVDGLRACFRKAVYAYRFPTWDGQPMGVDYHFVVGD